MFNKQAEEALVGLALLDTRNTIQEALKIGLKTEHFGDPGCSLLWGAVLGLYKRGVEVDPQIVSSVLESEGKLTRVGGSDTIQALEDSMVGMAVDAAEYAKLIVVSALTRDIRKLGYQLSDKGKAGTVGEAIQALADVNAQYIRAQNPEIGNPADALEGSECWSIDTGLPFLDRLMRLVSGEMHFLAGDPASGKSTLCIHIASHCASRGIPTVVLLAESDALEVQLSMLSGTGKISATRVTRIRYDITARTETAIQEIRELWDEHFADLPLAIREVHNGADEVVSIIDSIPVPSVILIDHAFAVVGQSEVSHLREHQQYYRLFSAVKTSTARGNHVTVMLNQYTKAGRQETTRGPDSQYGGSGVQNIAGSMVHLRKPQSDYTQSGGYQLVLFEIVKIRSRLVVDAEGRPVEPLGAQGQFFVESHYRRIVERLPVAGDK